MNGSCCYNFSMVDKLLDILSDLFMMLPLFVRKFLGLICFSTIPLFFKGIYAGFCIFFITFLIDFILEMLGIGGFDTGPSLTIYFFYIISMSEKLFTIIGSFFFVVFLGFLYQILIEKNYKF